MLKKKKNTKNEAVRENFILGKTLFNNYTKREREEPWNCLIGTLEGMVQVTLMG